jgi:hypothetical protein
MLHHDDDRAVDLMVALTWGQKAIAGLREWSVPQVTHRNQLCEAVVAKAPQPDVPKRRPGAATTHGVRARHDQLTLRPAIIVAQQIKVAAVDRYRAAQPIGKF